MIIAAAIAGFIGVLGLFAAANLEEKALLPIPQQIDVQPTDV